MKTPLSCFCLTVCLFTFVPNTCPADDNPVPIPASKSVIHLPADHCLHRAPTEWCWHTGTLKSGDRIFGFEINAASFRKDGFALTQIILSDVKNKRHFQRTTPFVPLNFNPDSWAEHDVNKDWAVKLGDGSNQLSATELIDPRSGYTSAPKVRITGGGGSGAVALMEGDKIRAIVLPFTGTGYKSLPEIAINGGGTGTKANAYHT